MLIDLLIRGSGTPFGTPVPMSHAITDFTLTSKYSTIVPSPTSNMTMLSP